MESLSILVKPDGPDKVLEMLWLAADELHAHFLRARVVVFVKHQV